MRRLFQLYNNPILKPIVNLMIRMQWQQQRGLFRPGDWVKYNWKAKVIIGSLDHVKEDVVYTVKGYEPWSTSLSNVQFSDYDDHSGCDVFWLRYATKAEIEHHRMIINL